MKTSVSSRSSHSLATFVRRLATASIVVAVASGGLIACDRSNKSPAPQADTEKPRTDPMLVAPAALAKTLGECAPGANEAAMKDAADAVQAQARAQKLSDQSVKDALWGCYEKFQASKAKLPALATSLREAILAVNDPGYGPKALAKLTAAADTGNADDAQFWQLTAVQIVGQQKLADAAKPLVLILLSPAKKDLRAAATTSLLAIARDAEPLLLTAMKGSEKDFAAAEAGDTHKEYVAVVGEAMASISRPACREAVLAALAAADNDTNRTVLTASLTRFPTTSALLQAFVANYKKIPASTSVAFLHGADAHATLVRVAPDFFEASLVDWLVNDVVSANDPGATPSLALQAATKLMLPSQKAAVQAAVDKAGSAADKEVFQRAGATLDKCAMDPTCYVNELDQPIASKTPAAAAGAEKAAWMAAYYGNKATLTQLAGKVDKLTAPAVRRAAVAAIDHLAPRGDVDVASQLEKIAIADQSSTDKDLLAADVEVAKVAARLRARAP
jgi:hypothetical protein